MKNFRNIDDIANFLSEIPNEKLSIFYGAGMSLNAGLPLANHLKGEILYKLCRGNDNKSNEYWDYLKPIPFEKFMEFVFGFSEQELSIMNIFNCGEPGLFHNLLAHLIKLKRIKNIMTLNFDMLLEKACQASEINIQRLYSEEHFGTVDIKTPCYIKIHGSIETPKTSRIFLSDISKNINIQRRNDMLKYFFCDSSEEYIIVLGYSCSDYFDIIPFLYEIKYSSKKIIFINHTDECCTNVIVEKNKGCFEQFDGYHIQCNTNLLLKEWSKKEKYVINNTIKPSFDWHTYLNNLSNLTYSAKLIIASLIQHRTLWQISSKLFKELLLEYESILPITIKLKIYSALSFNIYNLIISNEKEGQYAEDKYYYINKAIQLLKENPDIDKYIYRTIYLKYAKLLTTDSKFNEALEIHNNMLKITLDNDTSEKDFKMATYNNSIGELYYHFYKRTKDYSKLMLAKSYYMLAFDFFNNQGGYVLEKGIIYFNIANLLFEESETNVENVNDYLCVAERLSKLVGDSAGEVECQKLRDKLDKRKVDYDS